MIHAMQYIESWNPFQETVVLDMVLGLFCKMKVNSIK